jgi:molybdopterin converting factor small subunit
MTLLKGGWRKIAADKQPMKVTLNTFANIKDIIGEKTISVSLQAGSKLLDLFHYLHQTYGNAFDRQVRDQLSGEIVPFLILINQKTFRSIADMDTLLNEGDEITIMIPFDGG